MDKIHASNDADYLATVKSDIEQYLSNLPNNVQRSSMKKVESDYDLYLLHGQLSCQRDLPDEALRSFQECLHINRGSFTACTAIGLIHRGQGDYKKAEEYLENAHAIEPQDFKTKLLLLYLKLQLNRPDNLIVPLENEMLSSVRSGCANARVDYKQFTEAASLLNKHPDWGSAFTDEVSDYFRQHKFTTLRQVAPPPLIELLYKQYMNYLENGLMLFQKDKDRYVKPDDPLSSLVQHQLCGHIQKLVGYPIVPTYTIGLHYIKGGNIKPHTDRYQNEISMSMCIGADPAPVAWPLYALESNQEVYGILQPNDAFLYRGNEIVHYRKPLPGLQTVTQLIIGFRSINEKHCNCQ